MKRVYFLVTASLLAACGGGSSGGGVTPSHAVSNVQQIPVQRTVAAQSLQTEQSTQSVNTFAGIGGTTILAKSIRGTAKRVTSAWHAGTAAHRAQPRAQVVAYGPCTNGTESAQVTVSPTETQIYERVFYDRSCAQIYQDVFLDIVASSASSASATGTVTQYNQSGTAVEYNTLQPLGCVLAGYGADIDRNQRGGELDVPATCRCRGRLRAAGPQPERCLRHGRRRALAVAKQRRRGDHGDGSYCDLVRFGFYNQFERLRECLHRLAQRALPF